MSAFFITADDTRSERTTKRVIALLVGFALAAAIALFNSGLLAFGGASASTEVEVPHNGILVEVGAP